MGIPAWIWFTTAGVAAVIGATLLWIDRGSGAARNRERQRWASLRGWTFTETDHGLPAQWGNGVMAYGEQGVARDVVTGSTFTADGRRKVHVFDYEQNGRTSAVVVAVQCAQVRDIVVELWMPSVTITGESGLDLLGPVGDRFAFVSDMSSARPMITPDLVDACDEIGHDVTVVWLEDAWVAAAAAPNAGPARLERLLRDLGELADLVDPADVDYARRVVDDEVDGDEIIGDTVAAGDTVFITDPVEVDDTEKIETPETAGETVVINASETRDHDGETSGKAPATPVVETNLKERDRARVDRLAAFRAKRKRPAKGADVPAQAPVRDAEADPATLRVATPLPVSTEKKPKTPPAVDTSAEDLEAEFDEADDDLDLLIRHSGADPADDDRRARDGDEVDDADDATACDDVDDSAVDDDDDLSQPDAELIDLTGRRRGRKDRDANEIYRPSSSL